VGGGAVTRIALLPNQAIGAAPESESDLFANRADDDRASIGSGDRVVLIVENDLAFAKVLLDAARLAGFKGLVSHSGAGALALAREFHPAVITLDIFLPDMKGWRILDRLKTDAATRHVPVCVVSTDDARERALRAGAIGFLAKPLQSKDLVDAALAELYAYCERPTRRLLVAMAPSPLREDLVSALDGDVEVVVADDAQAVRDALEAADGLVVDGRIPGIGPEDVLDSVERVSRIRQLPVLLHADAALPDSRWQGGRARLATHEAHDLEALLAQAAFVLHRSPASLSERERAGVEAVHGARGALRGRKALIVDDDVRNIFALATVLDDEGMQIVSADNGREAIQLIESESDIDIVLMDIMMPEMDGIATMQEIRKLPRGRELPMVAVTAKAMKGDRQKCIEAGAWDYLSKPVDPVNLLVVLRGWLCR
jgi:CheY-like chemotaxis protein